MSLLSTKANFLISKAFNLPILQSNRLKWIDYLRGIAIILVVYRHVLIGIERANIYLPDILVKGNIIFYSFRMPLFFILSGIFIHKTVQKRSLGNIISIKFENLLYPYFIWCFLQITLQIVFAHSTNASRGIIDYTYIFYQPRNLDQFWYLPALFNCSLVFLLLKFKLQLSSKSQLILGILFYFLSPYFQTISMLSDWMEFYIFLVLGESMATFFFQQNTQKVLRKNYLLLMMIPVFIAVQIYYLSNDEYYYINDFYGKIQFLFIALTGCFSMLLISLKLEKWGILNFLRILGFHSLFIYVMHVFISAFSRIILTKIFLIDNPVVLLLIGIILGVTIPVIIYNTLIKDNILWFLFTYKKPKHHKKANIQLTH